ncbi:MAG TPA: MATE family efflux transporter, partial [Gemmatimonadales bacterium]|nr:MATE family efflux transporter [Gemmatimonadales bacterium]
RGWWRGTRQLLEPLDAASNDANLAEWLDLLAAAGEALCGMALWAQPDGRALSAFLDDLRDAARAAGTGLVLAAVLGLSVGGLGILLLSPLLEVMKAPADVGQVAREFLVVQFAGAFLIYGYFVVAAAFRSSGDTRTPFILLGASVLLNVVLDPLLILGIGPFPTLGVYGAALATVLTRALACIFGLGLLVKRGMILPDWSGRTARTIARVGAPTMLTGVLFSLIYIWLARVTASFGTPALAALGLGHKIEGVNYMICIGFAIAAETVVGQNLGAGHRERARAAGWMTARFALVPATVIAVVFLAVPESLARIFTDDAPTIAAAALYLRAVAIAQLALPFEAVLEGALAGAGFTFWPMTAVVTLNALRIPLAPVVATEWGLAGVWWLLSVTAMARSLALVSFWRWSRWTDSRV